MENSAASPDVMAAAELLGEALPLPCPGPASKSSCSAAFDPSQIELKYTHFSVIQNKGAAIRCSPRSTLMELSIAISSCDGKWALDGRIAREHQLGNRSLQQ